MIESEPFADDPFSNLQAKRAIRQLLEMFHAEQMNIAICDFTDLPYGDDISLRVRLNRADLNAADVAYLTMVGTAIRPVTSGLATLRHLLLAAETDGLTPALVDAIFEQLPSPGNYELAHYTEPNRLQVLQTLYLLLLRSGFWAVKHDRKGPIDTLQLGVDPLNVPELTDEAFALRFEALKGIEWFLDNSNYGHWNILQVLPRLVDEDVAAFLKAYYEWTDV